MLFKAELAQKIVDGVKTQTRRPVKAGEVLVEVDGKKTVKSGNRVKWQVGREYSVQYGRGLPTRLWGQNGDNPYLMPYVIYQDIQSGKLESNPSLIPLKIRVRDIRLEDVRTISHEDAIAEGFSCADEFLVTWCDFYDSRIHPQWWGLYDEYFAHWTLNNKTYKSRDIEELESLVAEYADFSKWLMVHRPADLYQAWALEFEVVR